MLWRTALLLLISFVLTGCDPSGMPNEAEEQASSAKAPAAAAAEYPYEITTIAAYYTGGPQQGRPPDGELLKGTRVKVLENAGSYSVVRSEDGIEAYVSTGAISQNPEKTSE
jgi:hypothetical protein